MGSARLVEDGWVAGARPVDRGIRFHDDSPDRRRPGDRARQSLRADHRFLMCPRSAELRAAVHRLEMNDDFRFDIEDEVGELETVQLEVVEGRREGDPWRDVIDGVDLDVALVLEVAGPVLELVRVEVAAELGVDAGQQVQGEAGGDAAAVVVRGLEHRAVLAQVDADQHAVLGAERRAYAAEECPAWRGP